MLYPVSAGYSTIATLTMIDRLYGRTKHLEPGRLSEPQLPRFQCWMGFQIRFLCLYLANFRLADQD